MPSIIESLRKPQLEPTQKEAANIAKCRATLDGVDFPAVLKVLLVLFLLTRI